MSFYDLHLWQNIVLEGAFKPWKHEKRLMNMCFDASGRKAIVPIK